VACHRRITGEAERREQDIKGFGGERHGDGFCETFLHTNRMNEQIHIFDRALVRGHRNRAAAGYAFRHRALCEEVAERLLDRLADVKRSFPRILDLGAHDGYLAQRLAQRAESFVVATDMAERMLGKGKGGYPVRAVADEEFLPFEDGSFDLIVCNLSLHWVNDLPGALAQIKRALRPDGLFLATILGGNTLFELRSSLLEAELALMGGISPRLSPNIDLQTASVLLQRAGFSLPVTDQEIVMLSYSDAFALMRDVRGMGESNAQEQRSRIIVPRQLFDLANRLYKERFALPNGRIPATFDVIFMHGWS
jgi:2-polyprenyl-3-methyl-5-hydroxy-6-metoxy-1,4-benzoquinol methylase